MDGLQDPSVTVYCSDFDPERKLRTSTLEQVEVNKPHPHISPQKLEKLNKHFADKSYNWRLKEQLASTEANKHKVILAPPPKLRRQGTLRNIIEAVRPAASPVKKVRGVQVVCMKK